MFWLLNHSLSRPTLRAERDAAKQAAEAARKRGGKKAADAPEPSGPPNAGSARETVDGLVFAFVLLILLRAFLLEPFVIPTGSMAPTLYGRHKECVCDGCGKEFQIGASEELISEKPTLNFGTRIRSAICPNCRKPVDVTASLAFNGDHIIVNKWAYELGEPDRFDVFVFKYPENAAKNYIKRLVGLPGETLRIRDGDLYLVTDEGEQIVRKPTGRKQAAMMQLVHDNDLIAPTLDDAGWPQRWSIEGGAADGRDFRIEAADGQTAALTYTHYVPSVADWTIAEKGGVLDPQPSLVSDFCSYNAYSGSNLPSQNKATRPEDVRQGVYWVSDLAVEFDVELIGSDEDGSITVELREGIYRYLLTLPVADGEFESVVQLADVNIQQDADEVRVRGQAMVPLARSHRVRFSQTDDQLRVWIDGQPVAIDDDIANLVRGPLDVIEPLDSDLQPVRILASGVEADISSLRLYRDLYYRISEPDRTEDDFLTQGLNAFERQLAGLLRSPDLYAETLANFREAVPAQTIAAPDDHYIALGDNSPRSRDSRAWGRGNQSVPREYLVGKAFWIYWPHGVPFLNGGRGFPVRHHTKPGPNGRLEKVDDYPLYQVPFYPQVSRMKRIR